MAAATASHTAPEYVRCVKEAADAQVRSVSVLTETGYASAGAAATAQERGEYITDGKNYNI